MCVHKSEKDTSKEGTEVGLLSPQYPTSIFADSLQGR